jgi:hypothetical protein
MQEIWKPVTDFEGRYEVSSLGRFKSLAREIVYKDGRTGELKESLIKGSLGATGYITVSFDTSCKRLAHRVVAEAFLEKQDYRTTVNHLDGNKTNNAVANLEWASYKENNVHARKSGLNKQHGMDCNLHKYSDQFIQSVRNVYAKYPMTYVELGGLFGLTGAHARQIVLLETRIVPTALRA